MTPKEYFSKNFITDLKSVLFTGNQRAAAKSESLKKGQNTYSVFKLSKTASRVSELRNIEV